MQATRVWRAIGVITVASVVAAGCGGDDDAEGGSAPAPTSESAAEVDDAGDGGGGGNAGGGGAGGGTVALGDQTIELDSARCFLQEQEAAAGGGKILFVAQGFGVDAAGEPITVDVSRYDEDSMFHGDDVILDVGDPFGDTAVSWTAGGEVGTVTVDGSSLSADGLTWVNSDDLTQQSGSFTIDC